jgi:ribonucleoside-triphosphate reductase
MKMPKCNAPCEVYSRVVGYLRPVQNWNLGKQEEFKERQTFSEKKAMGKV